ncbi:MULTISPECIES: DUF1963 domain-containing protein [unclassified Allomuricauda]|uniref:DUF1963 domain-containing protein n=1 Tax=unclassified Allomuricauda TaxID=2615049 RepID=UPI00273F14F2|nr:MULTISPECIES: DUF1963 domain-containing protein [unclassified Allomuricauda]
MNKLEQARDIVLNYDYPEDELANCLEELTDCDKISDGVCMVPLEDITPEKLSKSLLHYIEFRGNTLEEAKIPMGSSKFYGVPHLPKGVEWPKGYYFYAQLNFSEIKPYDVEDLLPDSGILYLFYEADSYTCKAIYFDGPIGELTIPDYPESINQKTDKYYLDEYKNNPEILKFQSEFGFYFLNESTTLNNLLDPVMEKITEVTDISVVNIEGGGPGSKIFGMAYYYQGEDEYYEEEEEMDYSEYDAYENILLLDNDFAEGNIHFWVPKEDLKQRNFDNMKITYSGT